MMVKRRTVLWGLLGGAILGCRPRNFSPLRVKLLTRSVPSQVLKAFSRETPSQFDAEPTLTDIYQQLQWWQSQTSPHPPLWRRLFSLGQGDAAQETPVQGSPVTVNTHLVTLSDPWLEQAIRQQLIQPLPDFAPAERLPEPWQRLLRRDQQGQPTARGDLWGVPYRTQGLMMAYQKPMFKNKTVIKWADLWRPELQGRIAMLDHPRLVTAVVLKALEYSVNDESALTEEKVQEQLASLYRQVRVFDSEAYLKALVNEDVWLAVGWSGDILATLVRYRRLGAAYPQEGSVLTSDLWVSPVNADLPPSVQAWMEFCWQPPIATQISVSSYGLSPLFFLPGAKVPEKLSQDLYQMPDNSEVLLPLSESGQNTLTDLFNAEVFRE
ncbi:MAG: extracellular solute-binding protein [Cyanobacteria bacterium P01_C01_bin.118]